MARKQPDLPGMAERKLQDLHDKAEEYATVRDERMKVGEREVELKTDLLSLMHKHKLTKYNYNGLSIEIVSEGEKIKVKVKPHDEA